MHTMHMGTLFTRAVATSVCWGHLTGDVCVAGVHRYLYAYAYPIVPTILNYTSPSLQACGQT